MTPGPWRVYGQHKTDVASDSGQVAACEFPSDARLIAAAPDLLAACELALETSENSHVRDRLRAAIARAAE